MEKCPVQHHGMSKARGCSHARLGSFSKLFKDLNHVPVDLYQAITLGGPGSPMDDANNDSGDSDTPAGYTFFAQFIDHDITLDTTTNLTGEAITDPEDIEELPNLRSAGLDLDCVYGFGPEASPYLYQGEDAPGRLLEGNSVNPNDVPRSENGTALIGDPRNDENIFLSQMQLLFIRFHNKVYDQLVTDPKIEPHDRFEKAQTIVRNHYQYLVVFDFLKRTCDEKIYDFVINKASSTRAKYPLFYNLDDDGKQLHKTQLPMPVEFSVAAYRFGHTTVRSKFAVNSNHPDVELFDERFTTEGFTRVPEDLVVDWRFLLKVSNCIDPLNTKAYDLKFASELINLPENVVGAGAGVAQRSLASRNLLRGNTLALASGQDIARELKRCGYPISTSFSALKLGDVINEEKLIIHKSQTFNKHFKPYLTHTPLFFYLMREAGTLGGGKRLGPVGSALILEVLVGGLKQCQSVVLNKSYKPNERITGKKSRKKDEPIFELADIIRFVETC